MNQREPGSVAPQSASQGVERASFAHRMWEEHRRWVAAILLAHKPAWADLDDLLQEVAVSVVRKLPEIRDENAVRAWLRTTAINAAAASARTGKRWAGHLRLATTGEDGPGTNKDEPSQQVERMTEGQKLVALAARLPDGYREPLLLKAVQGMSYREIGRVMGLPESTVETRIARARRQLREFWESHGEVEISVERP